MLCRASHRTSHRVVSHVASQTTTNTLSLRIRRPSRLNRTSYLWISTTTTPQWHPNPRRPPLRLLTPPLSPRRLLRHRPRRLLRGLQRHLPTAKRRNTERAGRRFIPPISSKVCPLYLIYSSAYSFDPLVVLKQLHPDIGISNKAMAVLNSFVNDIFERIATEASSKSFSFI